MSFLCSSTSRRKPSTSVAGVEGFGWATIAIYTHLFVKPDFCSFGNPLSYQRLLRRYGLNKELLEKQSIEKWDGKFPTVMGGNGAVALINISPPQQ